MSIPKLITYSLRVDKTGSDDYYCDIAAFANAWQESAIQKTAGIIATARAGWQSDGSQARGLPERSDGEYAFELLTIGVLLREHGKAITRMSNSIRAALKWLVSIQKRWPRTEKVIKRLRGWTAASGRLLDRHAPDSHDQPGLAALLEWLRANEENGKADRLAQWQAILDPTGLTACLELAERFDGASQAALGKYTEHVPVYLKEGAPRRRWEYDAEFVSRTRTEYHLGMLGTEVLGQAYRQRFLATTRRVVIVPPCMRIQPEEKCKAVATPFGARCQACTHACRVHQLTRLGEKKGFDVFIMPDELRVFGPGQGNSSNGKIGVVGVSCALTNWSGGWDVDDMGIPAQGLLLDYPGCSYHWDKKGIPTDTNFHKLEEILSK